MGQNEGTMKVHCKQGTRIWVEVKTYTHPVLNRKFGINVHGIEKRHYDQYLEVERQSGNDVWLLINETESGCVLKAKLGTLKTYHCICRGCQSKTGCIIPEQGSGIRNGIYFNREDFAIENGGNQGA